MMPAYHVERATTIEAPLAKVRPAIEDFHEWPKWSPWLCMEPTARLDYFGTPGQVGHGYNWEGELVGAGGIKLAGVEDGRLMLDLSFLRPFKSQAKVMFEIEPRGEAATEVTWHMDGSMPFFLFFMVGMMKVMIGMDYQRGLRMLKEYVETGTVLSKVEIVGVVDVPRTHWLGVESRCTMDNIGDSMMVTLPQAHQIAGDNHIELAGPPGALYHNVDFKANQCHYTSIVQTSSPAEIDGVRTGTIEPCRAVKVVHTGNYEHLGNAWSTAMAYQRYQKLKPLKTQCGFEFYTNDPGETPEEEWRTEIFVPVRG